MEVVVRRRRLQRFDVLNAFSFDRLFRPSILASGVTTRYRSTLRHAV